jgi:hypothetical protein
MEKQLTQDSVFEYSHCTNAHSFTLHSIFFLKGLSTCEIIRKCRLPLENLSNRAPFVVWCPTAFFSFSKQQLQPDTIYIETMQSI